MKQVQPTFLIIANRIFWPPTDGHKVVLFNYCKGLSDRFNCKIHVLAFLESGQDSSDADNPPDFIDDVRILEKPCKLEMAKNLLLGCFLGGPIQSALFFKKKSGEIIRETVSRLNPDYVFFDMARVSDYVKYIKSFRCMTVLYLEDSLSKRYQRQLSSIDNLNKTGGIAGKYSAELSAGASKMASFKFIQKLVLRYESRAMKQLEKLAFLRFDYVLFVSPIEACQLAKEENAENVFAVPLGVDCEFYASGPRPIARDNIISFMGDMGTSANADSLRLIVNEILPLLDDEVILEVSGNAPDILRQEFKSNRRVEFLGRVEDTRESLRSSRVFLCPISYGTGIKTKILEAMAIGVPLVTNDIGNEGIGLISGEEALVHNSISDLAADVRLLLKDKQYADNLAKSAQKKAWELFDWEKSFDNFKKIGLDDNFNK